MTDLLAIETSAEACSVAIYRAGETCVFFEHAPLRHAEVLLPAVDNLLAESGIQLAQLDAIAFGRGPGSFTSLRIGIGLVQGLAWGADIPVIPVSSLAAVAQDAAEAAAAAEIHAAAVCVALDARMQEVYAANFSIAGTGLVCVDGVERVCAPGLVAAPASRPFITAGNGFERFGDLDQLTSLALDSYPDIKPRAETVCRLALAWLAENEPLPAGLAQPVYLRNEVASKPDP